MNKFIKGTLRLNFKDYTNDKYESLVGEKFPKVDEFCTPNKVSGEIYDTTDQKVCFEFGITRPTLKECKAVLTLLKAKLKEVYGVTVEELFIASGSCF